MFDSDKAFLVKDRQKLETSTQITLVFHDTSNNDNYSHIITGYSSSSSSSSSSTTLEAEEEDEGCRRKGQENGANLVASLAGLGAGNEDQEESGFKTPTSPDHRLPELTLCPGAPMKRKLRFTSSKRKGSGSCTSSSSPSPSPGSPLPTPSSSGLRKNLLLDLFQEVESLFPKPILGDTHRERKRARSGGGDN